MRWITHIATEWLCVGVWIWICRCIQTLHRSLPTIFAINMIYLRHNDDTPRFGFFLLRILSIFFRLIFISSSYTILFIQFFFSKIWMRAVILGRFNDTELMKFRKFNKYFPCALFPSLCHRYGNRRHFLTASFSYILSSHWLKNIWHFSPSGHKHSSNLTSLHCLFLSTRTVNQMRRLTLHSGVVFSLYTLNILHIFWIVWIYSIICHSFSASTLLKH